MIEPLGLQRWSGVTEMSKSPILFEVCGVLASTISYHATNPQKIFTLTDTTTNNNNNNNSGAATMKCVFWEMDRRLGQLPRGATLRCIGRLNADFFHCLCVRTIKPREMQLFSAMVVKSDAILSKLMSEAAGAS